MSNTDFRYEMNKSDIHIATEQELELERPWVDDSKKIGIFFQ